MTAGLPRALVLLLGTASAVITVAGLRSVAWLVTPILLALIIVIVVSPAHNRLRRIGFPSWAATLVMVLLVYGTLVAFAIVTFVSIAQLAATLPRYADRVGGIVHDVSVVLGRFGVSPGEVRDALSGLDFGRILPYVGSIVRDLTGLTTSLVFLLALLLFLSMEATGVDVRLTEIGGDRPHISVALRSFARKTRSYLIVTTVFGFVIAVFDSVALALLGIPLPVLWGLLSFVTNYIPNIGFLMGLIPPAALALLAGGWQLMLVVILIYWAVNFVVQSLIQPIYVGDSVGLSSVMAFVSLVFWAWVLGPLGALLAIPVTLLVMALLVDIDPQARWAGALLRAPDRPARKRPFSRSKTERTAPWPP
ncbi:AI-2E family transporter [Actinocrispum sp. NPDC049592]|uniref:AI-2E family transporter n=1 Tax=Actinocrispum sp. NPDC049592 TaxID=3154835 RepID=UPI0034458A49